MTLHAALYHQTLYRYDRPVTLSPQLIRLRPAPHSRTRVLGYALKVEPAGHFLNWQQDAFGNWLARVVFPEPVREFIVTVDLTADMAVYNPFDFFVEESAEYAPFEYPPALAEDLKPYRRTDAAGPQLAAFLAGLPRERQRAVDFIVEINRRVQQAVRYLIRLEPGVQTPEETLQLASGSCRDSSWLLVQTLRHLGYAARFCSGYLIQLTPDVKSLDGPSGTDHDFTDLHAWCEVYLPGAGWIGLDPTSGLLAGEGHIPLCATPEPASAAPISGSMSFVRADEKDELATTFEHQMRVTRLVESARVTKPYREDQWAAIDALGLQVDAELAAGDVRLTQGGEPTFISIDDRQGAEWNTAAVGPTKQARAEALIRRLRERFAPGGLLTFGQGKWYPGESLPRWAYSLYWRGDGRPLVRGDLASGTTAADLHSARALIRGIAQRLEVMPDNALPAYEDAFHYLHRERQLPENVLPEDNKLKDPEERARIARVFERGLDTPRGYALPVQRWQSRAWISERWSFRAGRLFLIPGDSPIGFRLPLDALPWLPASAYPQLIPYDPFADRAPLPDTAEARRQPFLQAQTTEAEREKRRRERLQSLTAEKDQPAPTRRGAYLEGGNVRTALTVEPRENQLCVFLPPVATLEDYLDLVAAVEDSAAELDVPVRIEGYAPPADHRVHVLRVTPDPGVIEVNVHPARSWPELRELTLALYEEARLARLDTEKFLIDGRAVGTGGGNHVVVGGATPADSPFLRRPDLLGSLIRYWQNHPSLSYGFSGLFIGPTSQHPRPDEAQTSQLYEIELALSQLPPPGQSVPLWMVDRTLRNLLVDLTGNTHRTEISIDKLYSPDGPTGRLGLVEFRCFEMPPHAQMSLTQQLLLRALIARFWKTPYTAPLIRWGSALHDQFMLPHYLWQDFRTVLAELREAGYGFDPAWFEPHFEFRFPRHGLFHYEGIEIELRHALEPWPVLGEEAALGGTARYVDSSLERMQITARGLTPGRHLVTVGGRRLPLRATGRRDEWVAGLRYRAWLPASALHPSIGIHTPLIFDLYDSVNRRALGGCTYHVMHPAGRNYETFPVNSYEAESRRLARFQPFGHTPSGYWPAEEAVNPEYPYTLDLRRPAR
ncbi:MAG TPA: transglutaminase family protein [Nevskiaceae bacterium]|nr:transglutaminase family protein [Nevskiaceae bacterium]